MEFITATCSVVAVFFAYFAISREGRDDLKTTLLSAYLKVKRLWGFVVMVLILLFPLAIIVNSLVEFWGFMSKSGPVTRSEILTLFFNFFNLIMYSALFFVVIAMLTKARKELKADKEKEGNPSPEERLTEVASE